ncbi:MAG: hypothetical protein KA100_01000 [Rickettsiales bacterium]|nr:hypothetical protein [Rickettsiales bacterium]
MQITPENYKKLLTRIQKTIEETKQNIVKTVDRQKVEMSWKIGKDIEEHCKTILQKTGGNVYGKKLFERLAQDTKIEEKVLYKMRAFYTTYPKLPSEKKALSWSHYRNLIAVKDEETRAQLEELVVEKNLGSDKLQQEISKTKKTKITKPRPKNTKLKVTRGEIFNYVVGENSEIDLGFNIFVEVKNTFKSGEIVATKKVGEKYSLKKSALKPAQLHTYKAQLERVVDGDTIHVKLDLGFKIKHREILRLTQINAAEAESVDGKKATAALKNILKDAPFLVVKTNKTDIYGRYIADVFVGEKSEQDATKVAREGAYVSQLLLERGLVEEY